MKLITKYYIEYIYIYPMNIKLSKTSWVHPPHLSHHIHFPRPPILENPIVSNGLGFPATALASVPRWTPPQRTARGVGSFWGPQLGSLQRKLGDSQNMSKRQRFSALSQVERSRVKKRKQISNFSEMWALHHIHGFHTNPLYSHLTGASCRRSQCVWKP